MVKVNLKEKWEAYSRGEFDEPEKEIIPKLETEEAIKKLSEKAKLNEPEKEIIPKISYPKVSLKVYKEILHKWFYFEDEEIIDIQLAILISEKLPGDPLWLFLIAPPGALKTENLRSFSFSDDFYPLSDMTSRTFVSGLMLGKGATRRKVEDLLPQLNGKVLIFKDFTTILEKARDERQEIFAQLREIYDGTFAKKFGTTDKTIRYASRFGLLAGVTPIIDKHWKLMQQLGERFLKARWEEDLDKTTQRARENEGKEKEMREEINQVAMGLMTNLKIYVPDFDDEEFGEELDKIANFVAIARTPVVIQDSRSDFYFDYIPTPERPTRLVKQLKKMCRCLALIHEKEKVELEEIETIRRIAKDTIPQDRLKILEVIAKYKDGDDGTLNPGCPRPVIFNKVKMPQNSIIRVLEQMKMLDLVSSVVQQQEGSGYVTQSYYYNVSKKIKNVLYPPTFTGAFNKKGEVDKDATN